MDRCGRQPRFRREWLEDHEPLGKVSEQIWMSAYLQIRREMAQFEQEWTQRYCDRLEELDDDE